VIGVRSVTTGDEAASVAAPLPGAPARLREGRNMTKPTEAEQRPQDRRLEWQVPRWRRIEAGSAEDTPGAGTDFNGRLS
jgi:hypothetical protein